MRSLLLQILLIIPSFSIAQTVAEKIDFTYDNFNTGNFYDASKYLEDLEVDFNQQKFSDAEIIDFYDLSINCFIYIEKYENAIDFCRKKKKFIEFSYFEGDRDSITISTEIVLFQLTLDSDESSGCIDNILKISKGKSGYYLNVYNYSYLLKLEILHGVNNEEKSLLLKELESYNLLYYNSDSVEMTDIYIRLGICYMEISKFDLSKLYLDKSIHILRVNYEEYSVLGIQAIIAMGSLNRRLGDNLLALQYYNKAQKHGELAFAKEPQHLANLLQNKANILNQFDDFEKYKEVDGLYLQTLQLRKDYLGENHFEYAKALVNYGRYLISLGDFERGRIYITEGETIVRNQYDSESFELAFIYNAISELDFEMDDYLQGFENVNRELDIYIRNGLVDVTEFALAKSNLARRYWSIRNYKEAILKFEEAINLYVEIFDQNHDFVVRERIALASLYKEIGNYTKANEILNQVLKENDLSGQFSTDKKIDASVALIDVSTKSGINDSTYQNVLNLLRMVESSEFAFTERHVELLDRLVEMEINRGDFELSLKRSKEIITLRRKIYGLKHSKVADSFQLLSKVFVLRGEVDSANLYLLGAYKMHIEVFGENNPKTSHILRDMAYLELMKGNYEMGDSYFAKAIRLEDGTFLKTYLVLNEIGMREFKERNESETRRYIAQRIASIDSEKSKSLIELCEVWHNMSGINYSFNVRLKRAVYERNDRSITADYNLLKSQMAKRNKWVSLTTQSRINLNANIDSLDILINNIERKLYTSLDIELTEMKSINDDMLNSLIGPKTMYLQLADIGSNQGDYLCEIYRGSSSQPVLLKINLDTEYLSSIKQYSQRDNEVLYEMIWKPLELYTDSVDTIFISADGIFECFNIDILFNRSAGKYLFEYKNIVRFNNVRAFTSKSDNIHVRQLKNVACLYGFPDYDSINGVSTSASSNFKLSSDLNIFQLDSVKRNALKALPLPGTKSEVEFICRLLKLNGWYVSLNIGEEALESKIKDERSPRVLHIATHGYFLENIPMDNLDEINFGIDNRRLSVDPMLRSGLLLAGANLTLGGYCSNYENGLFSASEASFLDLKNTELVVLSACETGKGQASNNEGVYGLRKAFFDAGADKIIMSLWKIDDLVTNEFMISFYNNWLELSMPIREAFDSTRLDVMVKYPQPYYWGAFVLVGE